MGRLLVAGLAVLALGTAPAGAQIAGRPDYGPVAPASFLGDGGSAGPSLGRELADLRERIGRAREAGLVTGREARHLRREVRMIGRLGERYGRDGMSAQERRELQTRAEVLRQSIGRR
jgi:hypothetical protein